MIRKFVPLVILTLLVLFSGRYALAAEPNWPDMNKNYVQIFVIAGAGHGGIGSGFVFRDANGQRLIMTNFHVVRNDHNDTQTVVVRFFDQSTATATIFKIDPLYDLAVLRANALPNSIRGFDLATDAADVNNFNYGRKVYKIGSPLGQFDMPGSGYFCYWDQCDQINFPFVNYLVVKIDCNFGDSGCSVFDEYNKLVGICFAGSFYTVLYLPQNIMRVMPTAVITQRFVWMMARQQNGVLDAEFVSFERQAVNGAERDGGLVVLRSTNVILRSGDAILRVQDAKVNDIVLFNSIIKSFNIGDTIKLRIVRNGLEQHIYLTI